MRSSSQPGKGFLLTPTAQLCQHVAARCRRDIICFVFLSVRYFIRKSRYFGPLLRSKNATRRTDGERKAASIGQARRRLIDPFAQQRQVSIEHTVVERVQCDLNERGVLGDHTGELKKGQRPPPRGQMENVTIRHNPSLFLLDNGNAPPDSGRRGLVSAAAMRFQLRNKRPSGEGIAFLLFLCPLLIGPPEVSGTAPGTGMHLIPIRNRS